MDEIILMGVDPGKTTGVFIARLTGLRPLALKKINSFEIKTIKFYKRNALKMKELAKIYNGKRNIKRIVDDFFERKANLRRYYLTDKIKLINKFRLIR